MKKIFPSLLVSFIMICIGFSCNIFRPCCNKAVATPSVMSLLTGKQWITDSLYFNYTGPGTGTLEYARGANNNILNFDNYVATFWPDGTEDILDTSSNTYAVWHWSLNSHDSTALTIVTTGGTVHTKIIRLDATHLIYYNSTDVALGVYIYKP